MTRRWRRFPATIQQRLTLLTAVAVLLGVAVTGVAAYLLTRWTLYSELDRELIGVAASVRESLATDIDSMGGLDSDSFRTANVTLMIVSADATVIRMNGERTLLQVKADEITVARRQVGSSARTATAADGREYRIISIPLQSATGPRLDRPYALVIARPLDATNAVLQQLWLVLTVFGAAMAAVSGFVGSVVSSQGLRPLRDLTSAVKHITATDHLAPAPIETTGSDEISDLSRSFNSMLTSLRTSRERQRRLIADAGHELRTPLTSLRTNVELLVADERSNMLPPGARGEILHDVAAALGEFSSLIGDLVQLSREEQMKPRSELLDVADVVANAVTRAKRRGPGLHFDVTTESHLLVGEPDQLERAFTNLLDNAVKFSPVDGTITVLMDTDGYIIISDQGPGIAEEDLPHIFDRFYRSEKARSTPGTGLGLSIVSHTIHSHGGTISAGRAESGGAEFTVWLPEAEPETPEQAE